MPCGARAMCHPGLPPCRPVTPSGATDWHLHTRCCSKEAKGQAEGPCLPLSLPPARQHSPVPEMALSPRTGRLSSAGTSLGRRCQAGLCPLPSWAVSAGDAGEDPELGEHCTEGGRLPGSTWSGALLWPGGGARLSGRGGESLGPERPQELSQHLAGLRLLRPLPVPWGTAAVNGATPGVLTTSLTPSVSEARSPSC